MSDRVHWKASKWLGTIERITRYQLTERMYKFREEHRRRRVRPFTDKLGSQKGMKWWISGAEICKGEMY